MPPLKFDTLVALQLWKTTACHVCCVAGDEIVACRVCVLRRVRYDKHHFPVMLRLPIAWQGCNVGKHCTSFFRLEPVAIRWANMAAYAHLAHAHTTLHACGHARTHAALCGCICVHALERGGTVHSVKSISCLACLHLEPNCCSQPGWILARPCGLPQTHGHCCFA